MVLLSALGFCCVAPAAASARPKVTFGISSAVDAGAPTTFTWTAQRAKGSHLVVQRIEGTASIWRTVVQLGPGSSGSGVLPALPVGRYRLRLVELARHSRVLAAQVKVIAAFGAVPFSTLFHEHSGVYATSKGTFPYALWRYNGEVDYTVLTVSSNTCRSVHIEFIPGDTNTLAELPDQHGALSVVQQSSDPVSATAAGNSEGTLDAQVVPGQSWAINVAQIERGGVLFTWYINGSADCFSTSLSH